MRVLIELENLEGGQAVVASGEVCRVGRSSPADFVCADDGFLSAIHFAIDCSGPQYRVRDLASINGTLLNGSRITEAILKDGDRISAGQSLFHVRIETEAPSPSGLPSLDPTQLKGVQKHLFELFHKLPGALFALLDAARDDRILDLLRSCRERYQSLYEGRQGRDLDNWAPYLVELPKDSQLLLWLLHEGWGKSWGVYLTSTASFPDVRKHFRKFLLVETEDGQKSYFRFYDPRVLRLFLAGFALALCANIAETLSYL